MEELQGKPIRFRRYCRFGCVCEACKDQPRKVIVLHEGWLDQLRGIYNPDNYKDDDENVFI